MLHYSLVVDWGALLHFPFSLDTTMLVLYNCCWSPYVAVVVVVVAGVGY